MTKSKVKYIVDPETECWIWQRYRNPKGYGMINRGGVPKMAHRCYWEDANGPIPDGMEIDHTCRTRGCVNPDHMRLVTHAQNLQNKGTAGFGANRFRGVHWHRQSEKWTANAQVDGKAHYLGIFEREEDAAAVVQAWRREHMPYSVEDAA